MSECAYKPTPQGANSPVKKIQIRPAQAELAILALESTPIRADSHQRL